MATEPKMRPTDGDVEAFLANVEPDQKRRDSQEIAQLMATLTGEPARMWGSSIIGFGSYHYTYASGWEGDAPISGFSPRKQNIAVYLEYGYEAWDDLMAKLGRYKTGKSCLYLKRLDDVDRAVLSELISRSIEQTRAEHPS